MRIWDWLLELDRRWVFLGIALTVAIPIITVYALPLGKPAPPTEMVYDYIEALEPGSVVLVSFDYSPSSMPELHPQAMAVVRHCLLNDLRVISIALNPQGTALGQQVMNTVAEDLGAEEGVQWVHLGYRPGFGQVILRMGESIPQLYTTTPDGRLTAELPVMKGVHNYDDIALVVDFAASAVPGTWLAFAHERYGQQLAIGITAVMATDFYPYLQSHQLVGLINGLKGAAEYEDLLGLEGEKAQGKLGMAAQSFAHLLIIVLVVLGNIAYFASGRHRRRRR